MIIYKDGVFMVSVGRGAHRKCKEFNCSKGHQLAAMKATAWEAATQERLTRDLRAKRRASQRVTIRQPHVATIDGKEYAVAEYMSSTGIRRQCRVEGTDLEAAARMAKRVAG